MNLLIDNCKQTHLPFPKLHHFPSYHRTSRLSIGFARNFSENRGAYASIFVMCLIIMDKDFSLKNS